MKEIGSVLSILNEDYLLISSNESLTKDELVEVMGEIHSEKLNEVDIETLRYPKGQLLIVSLQKPGVYLASRVKTRSERRTIYKNSALSRIGIGSLMGGTPEEIFEERPITNPPRLDSSKSMGIKLNMIITVGDKIIQAGSY